MVMRIIKDVAEDIEEELEGAEHYMRTALLYKADNPQLAKTFYDISLQEMHHVELLHGEVVKLIEAHRKEKGEPPAAMIAVWNYVHEKHIKHSKAIKLMQAEYRGEA